MSHTGNLFFTKPFWFKAQYWETFLVQNPFIFSLKPKKKYDLPDENKHKSISHPSPHVDHYNFTIIHLSLQLSNNPSQLPSIIVILSPASVAPTTMMSLCRSFSVTDTNANCPGLTVVMSTFPLEATPVIPTWDCMIRLLAINWHCNDRLCSKI